MENPKKMFSDAYSVPNGISRWWLEGVFSWTVSIRQNILPFWRGIVYNLNHFLQRSYPKLMVVYNVKEEKYISLEHEITYIKIYLQFTKNKRRKQEFICFKIILPLKFIYNDNKSYKKTKYTFHQYRYMICRY